jgi:hypothetical protein
MPMLTLLPLDLKGTKLSNRVQNESRTLVRVDALPHRILLPRFGAFYNDDSLKIYDGARRLVPGTDYTTTYLYRDLSQLTTKPVYAFIVITNLEVSNTLTLNYQAVGGNFGVNTEELKALLDAINQDNFRVDWEDVVNKPNGFNPADHYDEYWQLYGTENTITVLNRVRDLLALNDESIIQEMRNYADGYHTLARTRLTQEQDLLRLHIEDVNNPHADDKTKIGLGNLQNWRMALLSESLNSTLDQYYSTPETGLTAINGVLIPELNQHISDFNNPHAIRAQDVDAYTTTSINTTLAGRLHKLTPAANSQKIFGYDRAGWKSYCNTNLSADLITQGLFNNAALGAGGANNDTVLMGNGVWKSWQTLMAEMDAQVNRNKILYVRTSVANYNINTAINYLNTWFADTNAYPINSKAVVMGYRAAVGHTTWNLPEVKFLLRTAGGWAAWLI